GWPAARHAVGQPHEGPPGPLQHGDREVHHALRSSAQGIKQGKGTVSRAVWRGPFVDGYMLSKAEKARESGRKDVIKIWSRRSTILPQFVRSEERRVGKERLSRLER